MKKRLFILFLLLITSGIKAQDKFSYGISGGANLIPLIQTPHHEQIWKTGWNLGAYVAYSFHEKMSIHAYPAYSIRYQVSQRTDTSSLKEFIRFFAMMNGMNDFDFDDFDITGVRTDVYSHRTTLSKLGYLELPITFGYRPYDFLEIQLGGWASYLVAASNREILEQDIPLFDATTLLDSFPQAKPLINAYYPGYEKASKSIDGDKSGFSKWGYGAIASVSYITPENFRISIKYLQGLSDYRAAKENPIISNKAIYLSLAVPFENLIFRKSNPTSPSFN
jgi:hypothetical protein